jgi:hypothetical protein
VSDNQELPDDAVSVDMYQLIHVMPGLVPGIHALAIR